MVGKTVGAVVVLVIAWTAGYSYLHRSPKAENTTGASLRARVLDESSITSRPIAYPLLLGIDADASSVGLSATSEHGILTVSALSPIVTLENVTKAASLLEDQVHPQGFSVMPAMSPGPVIWHGDIAHTAAHFTVSTDDTGITLSSATGRRLWHFQSPRPQFTLTIGQNRAARLVDTKGKTLWSGMSPVSPSGSSVSGNGSSVIVSASGLTLSFTAGRKLVLSDGHKVLWRDAVPEFAAIKLREPNDDWIVATSYPVSGTPLLVTWQDDITRLITVSIKPGTLTVHDNGGRISANRIVDMGRITCTPLQVGKAPMPETTEQPLFTPIAPMYVDGSTITAKYERADGGMKCDETIHYDRNGGATHGSGGSGLVTRHVDCSYLNGSSSYETSYPAPKKPRSTVWNW